VKEKATGALLFGIGFSSVEKVALSASLSQSNVFGSGKFLSFNVNSGSVNKVYSISYLDPYYTIDGVSQGFDLYRRKTDASGLAVGPYATDAWGGGVKFGYPTSEVMRYDFGLTGETVNLRTFDNSPLAYVRFVNDFGNNYAYGSLTAGVSRDTRDSLIVTTSGSLARLSSELAQGDLRYLRLRYQQQYYQPLTRRLTLLFAGEVGVAGGLAGRPLPFFKNFYAGGPDTVRGYRPFSLGPRDELGNTLGGNRELTASAQILFPMPGAAHDPSVRLSWFVDGGNVFEQSFQLNDLRYATGLALLWSSPFGPLRLSIAQPLNAKDTDQIQRLQFTFGTGF
jgi:outer membrane protein insertion porin family